MKLFNPSRSNAGAHIIEYSLLMILVMTGILAGNYYIPRAWNAYVHGESGAIQDSYNDPFLNEIGNVVLDPCVCSDPISTNVCGGGSCAATEILSRRECNHLGCHITLNDGIAFELCTPDPRCCTPFESTGNCAPTDPLTSNCGGEELEYVRTCGNGIREYDCIIDDLCLFECVPPAFAPSGPPREQLCIGDDLNLPSDVPYTRVVNCTAPIKCEVQCLPPLVPSPSGGCDCAFPSVDSPCTCEFDNQGGVQ